MANADHYDIRNLTWGMPLEEVEHLEIQKGTAIIAPFATDRENRLFSFAKYEPVLGAETRIEFVFRAEGKKLTAVIYSFNQFKHDIPKILNAVMKQIAPRYDCASKSDIVVHNEYYNYCKSQRTRIEISFKNEELKICYKEINESPPEKHEIDTSNPQGIEQFR